MQPYELTVVQIRLTCEAVTTVQFGVHAGAQWRGALWETLRAFACTDPSQQGQPAHSWHCPMCFVLALEADSPRGVNPARPLVIRPPIPVRAGEACLFMPGETFMFELILMGEAQWVFPYLLQAVVRIGQQGIGFGRGRYTLLHVEELNPLMHDRNTLYEVGGQAHMPKLPITGEQVTNHAERLSSERLWLRFLTPTQIVCDNKLLARPQMEVVMMRILERLQALEYHYGESAPHETWKTRHDTLTGIAEKLVIRRDETRWIRAQSGSRRANRLQDVSGFVGGMLLEGDLTLLKPWLVWAALVNVGKNAIKGNGWLEVGA